MAEPSSASTKAPVVASDLGHVPTDLDPPAASLESGKRSAAEAFEEDSVEDLKDNETTLDDVLVSPVTKKSKLLDEELPDVDDDEEFPQEEEDLDADLALGLENGPDMDENGLNMAVDNQDVDNQSLNMDPNAQDVEDLAPEEEEAEDSEPPTSQNNEIDIVDVDEDEEEEENAMEDFDEEGEEMERAMARAKNQAEARHLLQQLDDSARSKLCLTALEKYGEELFYGHEDARDAILVDACSQDAVLSLMRDAIRVRDLYLRGSSAAAPVELDDEEEDDAEGYEGEEEEEVDDEEEKPAPSTESNDDDIVVISEEEEEDEEGDSEAPNSGSEGQIGDGRTDESDENIDGDTDTQPLNDAEGSRSDVLEETKEGEDSALGDVEAAGDATSEASVADTAT